MTSIKHTGDTEDMGPTITPNTPVSIGLIIAAAGLIMTVILSFASVSARVSVLEDANKTRDSRLERIEDKVDRLLERAR